MNSIWGVAIPGLAMAASELPDVPGLLRLDNPEIGRGPNWASRHYCIEDVAEYHARNIAARFRNDLTVIGMSMGGMIVSIIASRFRDILPKDTRFRVVVSSPNTHANQAIPDHLLAFWKTAKPGNEESFATILRPFFSNGFLGRCPETAAEYYSYRAKGKNEQSPAALFRQIAALRNYEGSKYWSSIDPDKIITIGGGHDYILGPKHSADLRQLLPRARHLEIQNLGHMANLEMPGLFLRELAF